MIRAEPYDPGWPQRYEEVSAEIASALSRWQHETEHVGSTSVPGLMSKPVIDVLVGVAPEIVEQAGVSDALATIGLEPIDARSIPLRRIFARREGDRSTNIHVVEFQGQWWWSLVIFRDWLVANPEQAAAYGQLKRDLAAKYPYDPVAYGESKHEFVRSAAPAAVASFVARHSDVHLPSISKDVFSFAYREERGEGGGGGGGEPEREEREEREEERESHEEREEGREREERELEEQLKTVERLQSEGKEINFADWPHHNAPPDPTDREGWAQNPEYQHLQQGAEEAWQEYVKALEAQAEYDDGVPPNDPRLLELKQQTKEAQEKANEAIRKRNEWRPLVA